MSWRPAYTIAGALVLEDGLYPAEESQEESWFNGLSLLVEERSNKWVERPYRDEALQFAHEAEEAIPSGDYLGLMDGIPLTVKDQAYIKEIANAVGSPCFPDLIPDEDATRHTTMANEPTVFEGPPRFPPILVAFSCANR